MNRIWKSLYSRISLLYLDLSFALCLACAWVTVCHFRTFMGAVNQRLDRGFAASLAPRVQAAASGASRRSWREDPTCRRFGVTSG